MATQGKQRDLIADLARLCEERARQLDNLKHALERSDDRMALQLARAFVGLPDGQHSAPSRSCRRIGTPLLSAAISTRRSRTP